jgi:hypothetical protein
LRGGRDMTDVYFAGVVRHTNVVMACVNMLRSEVIDIILDILQGRFRVCKDERWNCLKEID